MGDEITTCSRCGAPLPGGVDADSCPRCLLRLGLAGAGGDDPSPLVFTATGFDPLGAPPTPEELAPHFPQLEIVRVLGQGGMGVVYEARQQSLDRRVALKLLPALRDDPSFEERFAREARALARLSHPGIVAVYDFGRAGERPYLLMEFVDGLNLRQLIRAGDITPKQALDIVGQICDALQFAHDEGVVHRDIKPENVLVDRRGRVKITDFGLAKLLRRDEERATLTQVNQIVGTPHYMAPEQIERPLEVDHRADIYSLGVVFYELLTGELPIGRFQPPSGKAHVDGRVDQVVLKSLESEPQRRYQAASQVKTDVDAIGRQPAASPRPAAPPRRGRPVTVKAKKKSSSTTWVVLASVLFVVGCLPILLIGFMLFFYLSRDASYVPAPTRPMHFEVQTEAAEEIRATATLSSSEPRLQRLTAISRDYELSPPEQEMLVDAILVGGFSSDMADAMVVFVENQAPESPQRRYIISHLDQISFSDDQQRVLDALEDLPPPDASGQAPVEWPLLEDAELSGEHDASCTAVRHARNLGTSTEMRSALLELASGPQLTHHAQHCLVSAAFELQGDDDRAEVLVRLLETQPFLEADVLDLVERESERIVSLSHRARVMEAGLLRAAREWEGAGPLDPLAHEHGLQCALVTEARDRSLSSDRYERLVDIALAQEMEPPAVLCYLEVVRDSGGMDDDRRDALLALIDGQAMTTLQAGLVARVAETLAFQSDREEVLDALVTGESGGGD